MKTNLKLFFMLLLFVGLQSCDKSNGPDGPAKGPFTVELKTPNSSIREGAVGEFVYFSFVNNKKVEVNSANAAGNSDWDIAFLGLEGRTNSGESGAGKGSVYMTNTNDFDGIESAEPFLKELNLWETDIRREVAPSVVFSSNPLLAEGAWYTRDAESGALKVSDRVFIIRIAKENRYVKLQLLDVKSTEGAIESVRFRYDFVSDKGENGKLKVVPRENEKIVMGEGRLSEKITEEEAAKIKYLVVKNMSIRQVDFSFIRDKMKALVEVDMADATFDLDYDDTCFKNNKSVKKFIAPRNLEEIGRGWFGYCQLETIIFPGNSLKRIGSGAFCFSPKLKNLKLPASVESIENDTFWADYELENIVIPAGVELIPERMFLYCKNLKSVTFLGKVRSIGAQAFDNCTSLRSIRFVTPTPPAYEGFPFSKIPFKKDGKPYFRFYVPKGTAQTYLKSFNGFKKDEYIVYFQEDDK
ncbi:MAG: leucine-rich repeat protein [Porphyromonas sp.]|nr:leucine-rich repeat protein [Porphyromonas sp.]